MKNEMLILKIMQSHEREWSWQQIDRSIADKGMQGGGEFLEQLYSLIQRKFIQEIVPDPNTYPVYRLTDEGRKYLRDNEVQQ